jgi:hypothetical protein
MRRGEGMFYRRTVEIVEIVEMEVLEGLGVEKQLMRWKGESVLDGF